MNKKLIDSDPLSNLKFIEMLATVKNNMTEWNTPLTRKQIIKLLSIKDNEYEELRVKLVNDPNIRVIGSKRGTKYMLQSTEVPKTYTEVAEEIYLMLKKHPNEMVWREIGKHVDMEQFDSGRLQEIMYEKYPDFKMGSKRGLWTVDSFSFEKELFTRGLSSEDRQAVELSTFYISSLEGIIRRISNIINRCEEREVSDLVLAYYEIKKQVEIK